MKSWYMSRTPLPEGNQEAGGLTRGDQEAEDEVL